MLWFMFVWQLPLEVCKLFNVIGILHTPAGVGNARISRHYRASFTATFILHPVSLPPATDCKLCRTRICACPLTIDYYIM